MKQNIVLIGFMGSGKTTVGKRLGKKLSYGFLDTDQWIEDTERRTISDIFEKEGEEFFRELETKAIEALSNTLVETVVSTGGGLPLREKNAVLLKDLGFVVYLKAAADTILKRLEGDTKRPLLAGGHVEDKVNTLLDSRHPKYEAAAHMVVETDGRRIEDIIEEIISGYDNEKAAE